MTAGILRRSAWLPLAALVTVVACTNTPPPPDSYVSATLIAGRDSFNNTTACAYSSLQYIVSLGTARYPKPTTVADGATQAGAAAHIDCSVTGSNGGFDIVGTVTIEGLMGGTFTVAGHVDSSGNGTGLSGTFTGADTGTFAQSTASMNGCTFSTQTTDGYSPATPAVAPGRVWGHLSCPAAQTRGGEQYMLPDGGSAPRVCDGEADFLFEQCKQ